MNERINVTVETFKLMNQKGIVMEELIHNCETACILHNGKEYSLGYFDKKVFLWSPKDEKDSKVNNISIGGFKYPIDPKSVPDHDFIKWVEETVDNFENHIINCCECGKEIAFSEIAGKYFAGVYCKDCWENKWKEIEAKEDYN